MIVRGTTLPGQPWIELSAEALAMHDKGRKDWLGHSVKLAGHDGTDEYYIVDQVLDRGDGIWRLVLIPPPAEGEA